MWRRDQGGQVAVCHDVRAHHLWPARSPA
jgi:hypothetical protein